MHEVARETLLRARAERVAKPPLDEVVDFLQGVVADADGLSEIEQDIRSMARSTTFGIELWVRALETVLAMPAEQSKLGHLLAVHGNTVLQDPSDEGARLFLREIGDISKKVLEEQAAASRRQP